MGEVHPELKQVLKRLANIGSAHKLIDVRGSKRRALGRVFQALNLYKKGTYPKYGIWNNV